MNRQALLHMLAAHHPADPHELRMRDAIIAFINQHENCHSRDLAVGHLTGSAWIIDAARAQTLLLHHGKLDKWLQPGGHVERGDADMLAAATREACEETGLPHVIPVSQAIFDVDIHEIPARPGEPRHDHYDIRFAFIASPATPLTITSESKKLSWIPLDAITAYTTEESVLRMARKSSGL
ncbi:MAG: NUDIX hydrolase [Blastocatellia bacterium]